MIADQPIRRYLTLIFVLALAVSVLMLALPRLQAAYRYLPVEIAIGKYFSSREMPSDRLPVLIRYAREAIDYHDHYRYRDGLSILHLLRAQDVLTPVLDRRSAYEEAAQEARVSLSQAPAQSATWMRLALVRWILREEPEDIVAAWKMSIFTGRKHSTLIIQRLEIGLAHRSFMDDEAVSMLRDQLLLAWRMQAGSLIRLLYARDPQLAVTRELIGQTDPAALLEMEVWIERIR